MTQITFSTTKGQGGLWTQPGSQIDDGSAMKAFVENWYVTKK